MHVRDQRLVEVQKAAVDDEEQKVVLVQGWPNQVKDVPAQNTEILRNDKCTKMVSSTNGNK